jgi:Uma2 family endonuclease
MRMSSRIGQASDELPAVDEYLVAPESGYEIDDGKLVRVPPSLEPHGNRHSKIAALLEAHVAEAFDVAIDMLTRTSETTNLAPDASVYPRERDPRTGGRQLEHLAFEVVSTETLGHAADKAAKLAARGVRRLFAIDVERARAFEWSHELGTWSVLDRRDSIDDPALAVALPVDALVHAAKADDAMARALLAKRNPVLIAALESTHADGRARGEAEGRARGEADGRARGEADGRARGEADGRSRGEVEAMGRAIVVVLDRRGLALGPEQRSRIVGERDVACLERWLALAVTCKAVGELFD